MIFFAEILQLDVKYFGYFVPAGYLTPSLFWIRGKKGLLNMQNRMILILFASWTKIRAGNLSSSDDYTRELNAI